MSVKVTTWVWEHSRSRGPARLVLLAIADNAHDDGAQAWPSMATLVRKTGLGERTVHRAVKQLASLGELEVDYNAGPGLCNLYRVLTPPAPDAPPSERHPRQSGTPASLTGVPERHRGGARAAPLPPSERHPEPSVEPSVNRQGKHHVGSQATDTAPAPDNVIDLAESATERDARRLCDMLANQIEAWSGERPRVGKRWHDAARLLITRDGYTIEQVEFLIAWATKHEFWRANVLSMPKLREKRLTLIGQIKRDAGPQSAKHSTFDYIREQLAREAEAGETP